MIDSLSRDSHHTIRSLGQTLVAAYAYDNFDIDIKTSVPTVENSADTLIHMTSGDLMKLEHVSAEELRCSQLLWETSLLNPLNIRGPQHTYRDLFNLHPEKEDPTGLTRRGQFNAWKFREDLILHGPPYFKQLFDQHLDPETIEQIPIKKLEHTPA